MNATAALNRDKWTALWMSLAVPGAGQLWSRRVSCLPWMAAACGCGLLPWLAGAGGGWMLMLSTTGFVALAVASAEHAKRCREPAPPWRVTAGVTSRVGWRPPRGRAVALWLEVEVPLPAAVVWRRAADLTTFLCIDPFHARVIPMRPRLQPGAALTLVHCAWGVTTLRFGRLLRWREGRGYAVSDLSARGGERGFPHVFFVDVAPLGADRCRLRIDVRGKWTARWIPPALGMFWLRYVMREHARLLRRAM